MRSSCTSRRDIGHMANTIILALDREVVLAELQQSTVVFHRFRLKITSDYVQPDQKHMLKRRAARTQKTVDKSFAREIVKT